MAWQTEITILLRVLLDDLAAVTYTDETLQQLAVGAAQFVIAEMPFSQDFRADVANVDITPDPTDRDAQTRDDSFINLLCLKAACIVDGGKASMAAGGAVRVKDYQMSADLSAVAVHRLKLLEIGYCKAYSRAKAEYLMGQASIAGAAIMTPFRAAAAGTDDYHSYFQT